MTSPKPPQPPQPSEEELWNLAIEITDAVETHRAKSVVTGLVRAHVARVTEGLEQHYEARLSAQADQIADLVRDQQQAWEFYAECAGTPLMADVMGERDRLRAQVERLRKLLGPCTACVRKPVHTSGIVGGACDMNGHVLCGADRPCSLHDREDEKGETRG